MAEEGDNSQEKTEDPLPTKTRKGGGRRQGINLQRHVCFYRSFWRVIDDACRARHFRTGTWQLEHIV